jgi:hypothetical protein
MSLIDHDAADSTQDAPKQSRVNVRELPRDEAGYIDFDKVDVGNDGWWNDENLKYTKKGDTRWETLAHNGPMFPEPYVPHGIPLYYEGKPFALNAEEEEVVNSFAVMRETAYYTQPEFRKNFFREMMKVLSKRGVEHPIKDLDLCDFDAMWADFSAKRMAKLDMSCGDEAGDGHGINPGPPPQQKHTLQEVLTTWRRSVILRVHKSLTFAPVKGLA